VPAIAIRQIGMRGRFVSDQRSDLDTGSIVRIGSLGSNLGGSRVIGLGLAAMICTAVQGARHELPMFHPIARETSVQMISNETCETVIAEYIRTKGVTRCPTACVVPTQASVTAADRAALEEYRSAREQQRRERAAARARLFWGATPLSGNKGRRASAPLCHSRAD
jgi:hypothetical protein